MADVSVVVMIDVDLPALTSFIRSHKDTTVRAPVGTQGKFEFEFRKFLIAQQQAAISRPGRVLFTKEQPVLSDAPVSPRAMLALLVLFVPASEAFSVEEGG